MGKSEIVSTEELFGRNPDKHIFTTEELFGGNESREVLSTEDLFGDQKTIYSTEELLMQEPSAIQNLAERSVSALKKAVPAMAKAPLLPAEKITDGSVAGRELEAGARK